MDFLKKVLKKNKKNKKLFYIGEDKITYEETVNLILKIIKILNKHASNKRVGILFDHGPLYASSLVAGLESCATVVLLTKSWTRNELNKIIKITETDYILSNKSLNGFKIFQKIIFLNKKFLLLKKKKLSKIKSGHNEDLIIFSSGTTKQAKGVVLTKKSIIENIKAVSSYLKLNKNDKSLIYTPTCYAFSLSQTLTNFSVGASLLALSKKFNLPKELLDNIDNHNITGLTGPPAGFINLIKVIKKPINWIRYCQVGGTPFSLELYKKLKYYFPQALIFNVYGCTENSPRVSYLKISDLKKDLDENNYFSVGRNVNNTLIKIKKINKEDKIGEITVSGKSLFLTYWNNKKLFSEKVKNGYFYTGDMGYIKNKRLFLLGRKDFSINVGNEKVFPEEIENIARRYSGITDTVVYSKHDKQFGKIILMDIVVNKKINVDNLKFFIRKYLSNFKVPKQILVKKEIKRNLYGKVDRKYYEKL